MSETDRVQGWAAGQTAEDFADIVKESFGVGESGVVIVPCEDFTLPDHIVFGGTFEFEGHAIPYATLLSGAVRHFHGLEVTGFQAVPTTSEGRAYSMGLQLTVVRPS